MRVSGRAVVAALAIALASSSGCASDPMPVAATATVDLSEPDQVIAAALGAMFTWNPTSEDSPDVAYRRAAVYLSGGLAGQPDRASPPKPGSQWEQWRAVGASVAAQTYIVADETPPDTDTERHRVVVVVQSAKTKDGKLVDEIRHTAWIMANKAGDAWRVTSIKF